MPDSRRRVLMTLFGATGVLAFKPILAALQAHPSPQPRPSPNAPNPNFPSGMDGPPPTAPDKKAIDRENQKEIRADVTKLYGMVSDLKDQVDKTDATSTLSLSVVKKAQEIEKLAKQIKERAKG